MLEEIKRELRISHTLLDSDLLETIEEARADMVRAGVSPLAAESDDPLIKRAIKTYCKKEYCNNEKMAEGYQKSYDILLDNIRKSIGYMEA